VTYAQTWTKENRVETISGNGQSATYTYDGDGNRVKKVQNGVTTIYLGAIYEKNLNTNEVTTYYFAGAQRVAMRKGGVPTWFIADHLGSTSLALDINGNEVANSRQKYYPFGETRGTATVPTDRQFTGQRAETGLGSLYDYNDRFYSPALGRFLSADTLVPDSSNPQSLNRFSYTRNNPLKYIDPSGHRETDGCDYEGCSATQWDMDRAIGNAERAKLTKFYSDCAEGGGPECNGVHAVETIIKGAGIALGVLAAGMVLPEIAAAASDAWATAGARAAGACVNSRICAALFLGGAGAKAASSSDPNWPPNDGFLGDTSPYILNPGDMIDRYGPEGGRFVAPAGTPFEMRALPPEYLYTKELHTYEVLKELEVIKGIATPWFGQPGLGVTYKLPDTVGNLLGEFLKEIFP